MCTLFDLQVELDDGCTFGEKEKGDTKYASISETVTLDGYACINGDRFSDIRERKKNV